MYGMATKDGFSVDIPTGGQCRIPGVITPILPVKNKEYISGEIDLQDGRMLYINRAIGHSRQVRFMVRPEITVFTLTQA